MVHVVIDDVVGINGGGVVSGVVSFVLRGRGLGVDAVEQCSVARLVVLIALHAQLAFAVKPIPAIGFGGFFEYVAVKRRIETHGDAVAGKDFDEKVGAAGDGKDEKPSSVGSVLIGKGAGGGDGQSGD